MTFQHGLDQSGNREEANFASQEKGNGLLISANQDAGISAATFASLDRQTEAGETRQIKFLKVQACDIRPAQLANETGISCIEPLRISQGMHDRQMHTG